MNANETECPHSNKQYRFDWSVLRQEPNGLYCVDCGALLEEWEEVDYRNAVYRLINIIQKQQIQLNELRAALMDCQYER